MTKKMGNVSMKYIQKKTSGWTAAARAPGSKKKSKKKGFFGGPSPY